MGNKGMKASSFESSSDIKLQDKEKHLLKAIVGFSMNEKNSAEFKAALKIQRQLRRRAAWKVAEAENQWKLFSDLDTRDEADMLGLAHFMQTLMDSVPGANTSLATLQSMDEDEEYESKAMGKSLCLNSIRITSGDFDNGDTPDFDLPKGDITLNTVMDIMQVYRSGGALTLKSVQKILRANYKYYKASSNSTKICIDGSARVNVIGDIHGQLGDLFHIIDEAGPPGPMNKYVFNGDFVDRGTSGVEVICVLLALHAALPDCVILNRGNHEDHSICCVYGFQRECKEKYDELTFGMFSEVFRYLPLFTIINDAIFIIHGGLFHNRDVTLADLDAIDRIDYVPKPQVPYPQCAAGLDEKGQRNEFLKQLQRDALWSDPEDRMGLSRSVRGAGVHFGPDVAKEFLNNNNLKMIVRSHECVRKGYDEPYSSPNNKLLCTLFSASNYSGGDNDGAYMVFTAHKMDGAEHVVNSDLSYIVRTFKTSDAEASLLSTNMTSLQSLILKKRNALLQAFKVADVENKGLLTKMVWANIMHECTQIGIMWLALLPKIAPAECVKNNHVDYTHFLHSFSTNSGTSSDSTEGNIMDCMYAQRSKMEAIFYFFDKDGSGTISRAEFAQGCEILNRTLPSDQNLTDFDHILDMMDFDRNDSIDINEFFEVFRLLDAKDGKIDGVISIGR